METFFALFSAWPFTTKCERKSTLARLKQIYKTLISIFKPMPMDLLTVLEYVNVKKMQIM